MGGEGGSVGGGWWRGRGVWGERGGEGGRGECGEGRREVGSVERKGKGEAEEVYIYKVKRRGREVYV